MTTSSSSSVLASWRVILALRLLFARPQCEVRCCSEDMSATEYMYENIGVSTPSHSPCNCVDKWYGQTLFVAIQEWFLHIRLNTIFMNDWEYSCMGKSQYRQATHSVGLLTTINHSKHFIMITQTRVINQVSVAHNLLHWIFLNDLVGSVHVC